MRRCIILSLITDREKKKESFFSPMVQTYFIVQLIYWQKQKQSDHRNNLKETNENGATVIFAFSQQAPKLLTRTKKKRVVKDSI